MRIQCLVSGIALKDGADRIPLVIQNDRATVANLRAVVAVTLKIATHSFRISVGGVTLNDEHELLQNAGVSENSEILVESVQETGPSIPSAPSARREVNGRPEALPRARIPSYVDASISHILGGLLSGHSEHGSDSSDDDSETEIDSEEGEEDEESDDEESVDTISSSEGSNEDLQLQEQSQIAVTLLNLPNYESLKTRFDSDPRAAMQQIQNTNPGLFSLIGRHPQFFLDFVRAGGSDGTGEEAVAAIDQTSLSAVDVQNIESLMRLGFSRERCVAAYLRCDKDMERTARFLYDA